MGAVRRRNTTTRIRPEKSAKTRALWPEQFNERTVVSAHLVEATRRRRVTAQIARLTKNQHANGETVVWRRGENDERIDIFELCIETPGAEARGPPLTNSSNGS